MAFRQCFLGKLPHRITVLSISKRRLSPGAAQHCIVHGGGRRCEHEGCIRGAAVGAAGNAQYCSAHGGGKRCQREGCSKSAVAGGTQNCSAHGGGKRCLVESCSKAAASAGAQNCKAHGGGRRCQHEGCPKTAGGSTQFCKAHGCDIAAEVLLALPGAAASSTLTAQPAEAAAGLEGLDGL
jgi:hypothetical protein